MTTRQISDTIENIYGFEVSEGLVSDITDKLLPRIEERQNRPILIPIIRGFCSGIMGHFLGKAEIFR